MLNFPILKKLILGLFITLGVWATDQYAISAAESLGGITLLQVSPRVVTPNGDQRNDVVFFRFDTGLAGLPLETTIFDIKGARVGNLEPFSLDDAILTWNGKDKDGREIPAGIYIYSIKIGKNLATGTVVVAK